MVTTHNGANGDFGFQIAPMVDVVFVLLLFFMACAGLSEKFISVPVPGGNSGVQISTFLDIDASGKVSVNGTVLAAGGSDKDLTPLREFLAATVQTAPEDPVVIRPSDDARHETVMAVVNACRAMHVRKLAFR